MSEKGFILIHRKLGDHPRFKDGDWLKVWMFCLMEATHSENQRRIFKGQEILLKPGQFVTGRLKVAEFTGVHESSVQRILKTMEIEQQIEQQISNTSRLITVVKWKEYQFPEHQTEQPLNNQRTTTEQPLNTLQQCNNENNVTMKTKREKITSLVPRFAQDDESLILSEFLFAKIQIENPNAKPPNFQTWAGDCSKMIRLDNRTPEQIRYLIEWLHSTGKNALFWRNNILSMDKLRKQFDTLTVKAKEDSRHGDTGSGFRAYIAENESLRREGFSIEAPRDDRYL